MIGAIFFVYGLLFGSFYNVLIYRLPLDKPVHRGRSYCPNCNTKLKALDLIPVFSYVLLGGKCRYCKNEISFRYPAIELITGALFFVSYRLHGISYETFLFISFWSMLLIVTMIDWDHLVIMDIVLGIFSIINLGIIAFGLRYDWTHYIYGVVIGMVFYSIIYFVSKMIYKKEAFGSGDIFLIGAIGIVLGGKMTFVTSLLAFYVALFGILIFRLFGKKVGRQTEIPFGPSVCIAAFAMSIYGEEILAFLYRLTGFQ